MRTDNDHNAPTRRPQPASNRQPFGSSLLSSAEAAGNRPRRKLVAISVGIHVLFVLGLLLMPARFTEEDEPQPIEITFYKPELPELEPAPLPEPEPEPLPEPEPRIAKVDPPPAPEPKNPEVELPPPVARAEPEPPKPAPPPPVVKIPEPPKPEPKPEVRTSVFAENRPEEPKPEPKRVVRTAGFAQEQAAEPKRARVERSARLDAFDTQPDDTPERPKARRSVTQADAFGAETAPKPARQRPTRSVAETNAFADEPAKAAAPRRPGRIVADGSFSDGAVTAPRPTKAKAPASVTETGFGDEPGATPSRRPARRGGSVQGTSFNDEAVAASKPSRGPGEVQQVGFGEITTALQPAQRRQVPEEHLDTPVEIVSKPKPIYTDKARELRVEGEVVLEVIFDASGKIHVLRVVGGLGHGLDESAVEAAKQIKFTPARRNGQPVDYTARLRVVFRLA